MRTTSTEVSTLKPKRLRRWAKRPENPNDDFPNVSLSVRDVHLILRELESYEKRIVAFKDRESKTEQRHVRKLLDKLHQVRWTP